MQHDVDLIDVGTVTLSILIKHVLSDLSKFCTNA